MTELIERLEKATGPDRRLDAEIAASLHIYSGGLSWVNGWKGEWRAINGLVHLLGDCGSHGNFTPPTYTASIDAAIALVPEDCCVDTQQRYRNTRTLELSERSWARVEMLDGTAITIGVMAPTVPLAICLASLKARAALTAGERTGG